VKDTAVTVQWTGKRQFVGTDSGNHSVVISSHSEDNHTGVKPSEMLLLALGACSAYDVVSILEKKRYKLTCLSVDVQASQEDDPPWTFRKIHVDFAVCGNNLKEKDIQQAARLSIENYCSVAATVRGVAEITYDIHIQETED
jgi:putative redox protein